MSSRAHTAVPAINHPKPWYGARAYRIRLGDEGLSRTPTRCQTIRRAEVLWKSLADVDVGGVKISRSTWHRIVSPRLPLDREDHVPAGGRDVDWTAA